MTLLTLGSFSVLVRLTDIKTIGLWVLLNSLLGFSRIADFWSAGLVSFVAEEIGRDEKQSAARLVSTAMVTAAVGFFLVILAAGSLLYLLAEHIPGDIDAAQVRRMVPLMCITFWFTSVAITYHVGFLAFDQPLLKLIQNVGGSAIFFTISVMLTPSYGIWGILIAQSIQGVLMLGFGMIVFNLCITKGNSTFAWNRRDFQKLSHYGSRATLIGILQLASDPLIRLLMSRFGGLGAVTLMEVATRMIVAIRGLVLAAGQLMVPAFAKASSDDIQVTEKLYNVSRRIFILITVPVLSCLLALGPAMERIMLGKEDSLFLPMLWMLSIGWGLNIISAPAFFLLTARRQLRPLFWNRLLMLMAVSVFGFTGGYLFGVLGVTLGVTIGLAIAASVMIIAARKFEGSSFDDGELKISPWLNLPILMAALITAAGLHLQQNGFSANIIMWNSILGCGVTFLSAILVLPLQGLILKTQSIS